jgi:ubiquinone/menaquinone biosynthesis C-methylase UbiE
MLKLFHPDTNKEFNLKDNKNKFNEIDDLYLNDGNDLTEVQSEFYNDVKFPNYDSIDDFASLLEKTNQNRFIKKLDDEIPFGSKILEAGCGTGQLSIALSRYARSIYSIDLSKGSLIEAKKFINKNKINSVNLFRMNIFKLFFPINIFDVVISNGVLHPTHNPKLAFSKIVATLKPGGIVVIGLYSSYGRVVQKIRQHLIKIFGDNAKVLDKRFKKDIADKKKYAWLKDQYKNPSETTHTYHEIIEWFQNENIEYLTSLPFDFDDKKNILKKNPIISRSNMLFKELSLIFNKSQIYEGGFFIMIGKKSLK